MPYFSQQATGLHHKECLISSNKQQDYTIKNALLQPKAAGFHHKKMPTSANKQHDYTIKNALLQPKSNRITP
jgi:hypothetical protein